MGYRSGAMTNRDLSPDHASLDEWSASRAPIALVLDRMDGRGEIVETVTVGAARDYAFAIDHASDVFGDVGDGCAWYRS